MNQIHDVSPKALANFGFTVEQASRAKAIKEAKDAQNVRTQVIKARHGYLRNFKWLLNKSRKQYLEKQQTPELKKIALKEGFQTMQDMGRRMISTGELNFREYERVLST